jgi:hypothetical protein
MSDEMGTGPGEEMASPQDVAETIEHMDQGFRNAFRPVKEQIPAPGANRAATTRSTPEVTDTP